MATLTGEGIAEARAQATVRSRIHPTPWFGRFHEPTRERDEVATVADHDGVVGESW